MRLETLEILRCPYCGGRLDLVESLFHRQDAGEIQDGILGCHCCVFPVVDGIPVLHLQPAAVTAREQVQAARPDLARRTMVGLDDDRQAAAFEAAAASETATYRETVEALGPTFEGGYFLYRFSDPTYVVADTVVQAVAGAVLHRQRGVKRRAIDICGGSGHLTRSLIAVSPTPPTVLADLFFAKVWLARRFTAPECEPVCCDGNAPLPFARGTFALAMCTDAFMYIWTKRQFVGEMERLVDDVRRGDGEPGAVLIGHTHNERTWTPSHGQPLSHEGYRDLFEALEPRIFAEAGLFDDVVKRAQLDLQRCDSNATLDADPALTIVATRHEGVFAPHRVQPLSASQARGEFRLNPLYTAVADRDRVRLRLHFPSEDYAEEYGACRAYLPEEVTADRAALDALPASAVPPSLVPLVANRVILDLPKRYY
jgi:uncharacterized protein YbaR (Trm112 family)